MNFTQFLFPPLNHFIVWLKVQFQDGKECTAIKELYKVLKDHRNPFMQDLVMASFQYNYQDLFSHLVGMSQLCSQQLDECGTEKRRAHYFDKYQLPAILDECHRKDDRGQIMTGQVWFQLN